MHVLLKMDEAKREGMSSTSQSPNQIACYWSRQNIGFLADWISRAVEDFMGELV